MPDEYIQLAGDKRNYLTTNESTIQPFNNTTIQQRINPTIQPMLKLTRINFIE